MEIGFEKSKTKTKRSRNRFSIFEFAFSSLGSLFLKLNDGNGFSSVFLRFKCVLFDERVRIQELPNPFAKRAGAVAMNDAHTRLVRQRRLVEKLVHAFAGLLHGHA